MIPILGAAGKPDSYVQERTFQASFDVVIAGSFCRYIPPRMRNPQNRQLVVVPLVDGRFIGIPRELMFVMNLL